MPSVERYHRVLRDLVLAAALAAACAAPARAGESCPSVPVPAPELPHSRAALAAGKELVIVAIGSSSTQGVKASDTAHTYPAELQSALAAALPQAHVAVINRGIGGQDAREELARIDTGVLPLQPQLVIWQVGANGVLRHSDPEAFRERVTQGVTRLLTAGADVILMDNQQAPAILAESKHAVINQMLADVALDTNAGLFSRAGLMDRWQELGFPYQDFIASDGLHHNDLGYRCVAEALAGAILDGLKGRTALARSGGRHAAAK